MNVHKSIVSTAAMLVATTAVLLAACTNTPTAVEVMPSNGRTLSAQDRADIAATLAQTAENYGITDPPQVDVVRIVSAADYPGTQVDCLHDRGFSGAALTADGSGVSGELPGSDQVEAYNLASYTCIAQYPRDPAQDESRMTRDQKLIVYAYVTQTLVQCLADQGFPVRDVPSQETFLASWDAGVWNPYGQLADVAVPDDVERACPHDTPPQLVWGS